MEEAERLDKIAEKVVFQAGLDASGSYPLIVVAACYLPTKSTVDPSRLMQRITRRLEVFWGGNYEVVIFANPVTNPPPLTLLTRTYLNLPREARKNIKALYIVGGNERYGWLKMLLTLFLTTLLSPKTARKIKWCSNISALAAQGVDISQIEIPPQVYEVNAKLETWITLPPSLKAKLEPKKQFGVPLEKLMGYKGQLGLPPILLDCFQHLRAEGLETEGLFRRSPKTSVVRSVQEAYDRGNPVNLAAFTDSPFLASSLIKIFLGLLPRPLFPRSTYQTIQACPPLSSDESTRYIRREIVGRLEPACNRVLLAEVMRLLADVKEKESKNLMNSHNLAVCITPVLLKSDDIKLDGKLCLVPNPPSIMTGEVSKTAEDGPVTLGGVVKTLIERWADIFDVDSASVKSRRSSTLSLASTPKMSPTTLPGSTSSLTVAEEPEDSDAVLVDPNDWQSEPTASSSNLSRSNTSPASWFWPPVPMRRSTAPSTPGSFISQEGGKVGSLRFLGSKSPKSVRAGAVEAREEKADVKGLFGIEE
ncbi:Rho GTPase activation protein [Atractiella rhizophila]|nr:Rho GTPase activation protein [Atractiella rhizophila]